MILFYFVLQHCVIGFCGLQIISSCNFKGYSKVLPLVNQEFEFELVSRYFCSRVKIIDDYWRTRDRSFECTQRCRIVHCTANFSFVMAMQYFVLPLTMVIIRGINFRWKLTTFLYYNFFILQLFYIAIFLYFTYVILHDIFVLNNILYAINKIMVNLLNLLA